MPVISLPGSSHYEAGCHYASSYNTQACLTIGCAAWCFPLRRCLVLLKWYFMGSKQRKVRAEWGGQEMVFHRYGLLFSLSYVRDDENIIYKFLQVGGRDGRPAKERVIIFNIFTLFRNWPLSFISFLGGDAVRLEWFK